MPGTLLLTEIDHKLHFSWRFIYMSFVTFIIIFMSTFYLHIHLIFKFPISISQIFVFQVLLRSCADWTSEEKVLVKKILRAMGITMTERRSAFYFHLLLNNKYMHMSYSYRNKYFSIFLSIAFSIPRFFLLFNCYLLN